MESLIQKHPTFLGVNGMGHPTGVAKFDLAKIWCLGDEENSWFYGQRSVEIMVEIVIEIMVGCV